MVKRNRRSRLLFSLSALLVAALLLGACGGMPSLSDIPFIGELMGETNPPTPTPVPTPTATPLPTATPKPGETPVPATATPVPTPQVSIPSGWTAVNDDVRGYSLALPRGWTNLDLRGAQIQQLANMVGAGDQLGPLNDFLASPEGDSLGVVYLSDLMAAMGGGLPTLLNVYVLDAPGMTAASAVSFVEGLIEANQSMLGSAEIENVSECTVNNLPAVCATATANLAQFGFNVDLFAKVTGLIANDKIYILTLATPATNRATREPEFDQIIGTFRPE